MKNRISIMLIIAFNLVGCIKKSDDSNKVALGNCNSGISKAKLDAKKGNYELLSYGMPDYADWEFQSFYENFVEEKYGIKIGNGGCEVFEESECYANTMEELIFDKFGRNIFDRAKLEAKIEYKSHIQNQINNDFIFSKVDTMPSYKTGIEKLHSYLSNQIETPNELNRKILVLFVVEKDGSISNVEVKNGWDDALDNKIIKAFMEMPNWNSGIYHGQKVRVRLSIPVTFRQNKINN